MTQLKLTCSTLLLGNRELRVGNHYYRDLPLFYVIMWHTCYRYVVLAFDEMKIREDLVFDKTTGQITGFVDYGGSSLNEYFVSLREQCKQQPGLAVDSATVATHMLTLMLTFDIPINCCKAFFKQKLATIFRFRRTKLI